MKSQCTGRFQVELPDTTAVAGRSQHIYRVELTAAPVPAGGAQAALRQRVGALSSTTRRTFDLEPGVAAVWYSGDRDSVVLEAFRAAGDYVLRAVRRADPGREASAETLVRSVVQSYVPGVTEYGFCIGPGSLTIEPAQNESTMITFEDRKIAGLQIQVSTRTVDEPDSSSYSDLNEEKGFAAASRANLTVLREQARQAAGLEGKEIRIAVTPPDESPLVRFTWHFDGEARDATKPKIDIMGIAPAARRTELESIWDKMLRSFRRLPVSKQ